MNRRLKLVRIVDDLIIPILQTVLGVIGMVIAYVFFAGLIAFGIVCGAALACQVFGFDLFAWIGGL
jgi:hypothetical protein